MMSDMITTTWLCGRNYSNKNNSRFIKLKNIYIVAPIKKKHNKKYFQQIDIFSMVNLLFLFAAEVFQSWTSYVSI